MNNKFEILTFKDGDFSLPVNVSPEEDTVWLNIEEIGLLFERDRSVIGKHIKSIFSDFELEEKSNVQKMPIANSDKPISLYSLDVIIAVGYRVKSHRGIEFRKWANYVLKQFIFQKPNELLLQHSECIIDLQNRVTQIEINQKHELKYESGEKLQGYLSIKHFLETAKQSIYIIDDYFDHSFDDVLKEISVDTTIITDPNNELESNEIYIVKKTKAFHDRFIFVDGVGYHLGCSLKDIGNSLAIATRLESIKLSDLLKLIK